MNDELIDEGFEVFFSREEMLEQHCRLLEAELAELHGELSESRGKIATLVLMWSGLTRELAHAKVELSQTKMALEVAVYEGQGRGDVVAEDHEETQSAPVAFSLMKHGC